MTPQDPLAALQPLRTPEPIALWPPAPGWWLLAALGCAALAALGWHVLRQNRRNRYRRLARAELRTIAEQHADSQGPAATLCAINTLLKGVCLQVYPQRTVAALSGEAWLDFLNAELHAAGSEQRFPDAIARAHAADPGAVDISALLACTDTWLRRHRGGLA
jgi:hypothetical protein